MRSPASHGSADPDERPARSPLPAGAVRARAAEEAHRSFLRVASHELRTPLNAIIGFSEIIARELYGPMSEPRYRDHAMIVHESGLKLLKLVNEVLEIARLEAGLADFDLRPEDLAAATAAAIKAVDADAAARGVRLSLHAAHEAPRALADARALSTVLAGLLQMSIGRSQAGGAVEIVVEPVGADVVIEVRDEGAHVSPEDLVRMLRPFEHPENVLVRTEEGAGLRLTIVHLLCRGMGGRLSLRSGEGEGLTSIVRLKALRGPEAL
jgi:signal transduction histidine kinase